MEYTKEDLAIDGLIAATLRAVELEKEVSEKDILRYSTKGAELSAKDKKALASLGPDLFAKKTKPTRDISVNEPVVKNAILEESVMAMNRKNADDTLGEETKKEIERKREELRKKLEKERKKKEEDGKSNPGAC